MKFTRVAKGHYRHDQTGVEFCKETRHLAGNAWSTSWVVTEPVQGERSWVSTNDSYTTARAAAIAHIQAGKGAES